MGWSGGGDSGCPGHQEFLLCFHEPRLTGQPTGKGFCRRKHSLERWTFGTGQGQCPEQGTQQARVLARPTTG